VDLGSYLQAVLDWAETHAGLGGWVGALGAVFAIFVTWGLARAEYFRREKQSKRRLEDEIKVITDITNGLDVLVADYASKAIGHETGALSYYDVNSTNPVFQAIRDLGNLPPTQWPSMNLYFAFKRFEYASLRVLETSRVQPINIEGLKTLLEKQRGCASDLLYWLKITPELFSLR
jgi:hypothetical protein